MLHSARARDMPHVIPLVCQPTRIFLGSGQPHMPQQRLYYATGQPLRALNHQ
jgi:hypothetical protein